MLKISSILKKKKPVLIHIASFLLGMLSMVVVQSMHLNLSQIPDAKTGVLDSVRDAVETPLSTAANDEQTHIGVTSPFWEDNTDDDPLDLNVEVVDIDPEKKPEITGETVDKILQDFQGRISPEFKIPDLIFNQTKFWFRVYTEFDSSKKIIHDSLHPHIIYDVVDVSDIMAQPARAAWLNTVKAQKAVSKRVAEIRAKLKKMARLKEEDMDDEELGWLEQFEDIKGDRKKIIRQASQSLRIQTGQKDFFENGLSISGRYLDGMEAIFKQKSLPIELTRLPFVESSFVIGATSKVGAAGIWQFMPGIGRKLMTINDRVDERRNPWKATEAAAKLLKENYTILHKNWGLALTAYNHGPTGVRLAMQKLNTRDIAKIVRSYRSRNFDFASANFFTCFLAAMHAQMYKDILWTDHFYEPALAYDSIKLKKNYKPHQLSQAAGISDEQVILFNPELDRSFKRNYVVPKGYRVFLPADAMSTMQNAVALKQDTQ
jgi:membrane-bound lytic murein transglycosylase D